MILPAKEGFAEALHVLKRGGVVAHATETCYGLACDLGNPAAVSKLFAIKQRPLDQPVSALFSSIDEAKKWVEWNDEAEKLSREFLPGPLTLILPLLKDRTLWITPENPKQSIGVRVSSLPLAQNLAKEFGSPLSTTSANLHGQKNLYSAEEIASQFVSKKFVPDLILDSGTLPPVPPSTVIDLTGKGERFRRKGTVHI